MSALGTEFLITGDGRSESPRHKRPSFAVGEPLDSCAPWSCLSSRPAHRDSRRNTPACEIARIVEADGAIAFNDREDGLNGLVAGLSTR